MINEWIGKMLHGNFHDIRRVDRTDDAGPVKCALSVLYAGRLEVRNHGKVLPDLFSQTVLFKFFS